MAERSNAAVLKTVEAKVSGGSNPSLSATARRSIKFRRALFFPIYPANCGYGEHSAVTVAPAEILTDPGLTSLSTRTCVLFKTPFLMIFPISFSVTKSNGITLHNHFACVHNLEFYFIWQLTDIIANQS